MRAAPGAQPPKRSQPNSRSRRRAHPSLTPSAGLASRQTRPRPIRLRTGAKEAQGHRPSSRRARACRRRKTPSRQILDRIRRRRRDRRSHPLMSGRLARLSFRLGRFSRGQASKLSRSSQGRPFVMRRTVTGKSRRGRWRRAERSRRRPTRSALTSAGWRSSPRRRRRPAWPSGPTRRPVSKTICDR